MKPVSADVLWTLIAGAVLAICGILAWSASSSMAVAGAILMAVVTLSVLGLVWWMAMTKRDRDDANI